MLQILIGVWFLISIAVGAVGALQDAPMPPPAYAMLVTIVVLGAVWLVPPLRVRIQALGIGPLIAIHLLRLGAGVYFLTLAANGTLPNAFALVAGWGDIVVGVATIPILMFCVPAETPRQRTGLLIWNTVGLLDILTVLGNGLRLFRHQPEIATPFTQLPLALLPLFVVPLVISTHLWIFAWSSRPAGPLPAEPVLRPPEDAAGTSEDGFGSPRP